MTQSLNNGLTVSLHFNAAFIGHILKQNQSSKKFRTNNYKIIHEYQPVISSRAAHLTAPNGSSSPIPLTLEMRQTGWRANKKGTGNSLKPSSQKPVIPKTSNKCYSDYLMKLGWCGVFFFWFAFCLQPPVIPTEANLMIPRQTSAPSAS